ncbi:ufm1-specific protease 1-like [Patiria miniata]|uniref:UFSP1/2/DUB catalytic domain-containing protein n=1 Tax=Patiria miniata TaxID=46514 RepID=A0A914AA99_PATMI|nr:ufm1-specific protease 1-like [Patiria miniata]XP_038060359.1 ufm1-specific protease 1-like [Patiria miniata]XP_038060360.1 ufm1-specific protease 1-like [Patiria miniata]XP_038060361.1 ufm1-specific protease 1-like [Patiria miniata]
MDRLLNIHTDLPLPEDAGDKVAMVTGDYLYYHYGCDGIDDRGWGCGYRTLQTLCSWVRLQQQQLSLQQDVRQTEPTLQEVQEALVAMGDKPSSLIGSKEWIGSYEICICIDHFYDVPCKILHVSRGAELISKIPDLWQHFQDIGSPVMMGGDCDAASKGIMGICIGQQKTYLLVLDPHFYGDPSFDALRSSSYLLWKALDSFMENSFYNMCLPILKTAR